MTILLYRAKMSIENLLQRAFFVTKFFYTAILLTIWTAAADIERGLLFVIESGIILTSTN